MIKKLQVKFLAAAILGCLLSLASYSQVDGGTIGTADATTVCSGDGMADLVFATVNGNSGDNNQWVITDADLNILELPMGSPFDFDGAGAGICLIWNVAYNGDLMGAAVGMNAAGLAGDFALSNSIQITRRTGDDCNCLANGGVISTDASTTICSDDGLDDIFQVSKMFDQGDSGQWVITDDQGNIIGMPANSFIVIGDAPGGDCSIWYARSNGMVTGLEMGGNVADITGCVDFSNPIVVTRRVGDECDCLANGGTISTNDPTTICAGDDTPDPITVNVAGASGANAQWVITDEAGMILGLPMSNVIDLDGAGAGVCLIWYARFSGDVTGVEVGMNANDIGGCLSLSNSIAVTRNTGEDCDCLANRGTISTEDPTTICAGDGVADPITVNVSGASGDNAQWVITDEAGMILGLPMSNVIDLDGAGEGVCLIWYARYIGDVTGVAVGMNANDIGGCLDLSNPITVTRNTGDACDCLANGGTISTEDPTTICADDEVADPITVNVDGANGDNAQWVITDEAGMILGLPMSNVINLEGAGAGVCLIWYARYNGDVTGVEVGMNANDITGCLSLSNPIAVTRNTGDDCDCLANGGTISTNDPTTICAGDGMADPITVSVEGANGDNAQWVITDEAGMILGLPMSNVIDLDGAGEGVCLIWYARYNGDVTGVAVGMNANDIGGCLDLSNPITVTRNIGEDCDCLVNGGILTAQSATTICTSDFNDPDLVTLSLEGAQGANATYVITDPDGTILGLPMAGPFDLTGAPAGVCTIWHLSHDGTLDGAMMGANVSALTGCFDLSNGIEITRQKPEAGTLSIEEIDVCVGNGTSDPIAVEVADNVGTNGQWVITDADGIILGLPMASPFDVDGAGDGTCLIWHVAYEGELTGAMPGMSGPAVTGCYAISEPVTVNRTFTDGAEVNSGGNTAVEITVGDGIDDELTFANNSESTEEYVYIVTEDDGTILAVLEGDSNNFEGAGAGVCHIYGFSYTGTISAEAGTNVNAASSDECFNLSDNFVTLTRILFDNVSESDAFQFELYPVPTAGQLNLSGLQQGAHQVAVFDIAGKTVLNQTINNRNAALQVENLEAGTYTIVLTNAQGSARKRFIKK